MIRLSCVIIVLVALIFSAHQGWAQQRKVIITTTEGAKQISKEYSGVELDKLISEHKKMNQRSVQTTQSTSGREIIVSESGKKPVVYSGDELNKRMMQRNQLHNITSNSADNAGKIVRKMPDGTVKIIQNGVVVDSK